MISFSIPSSLFSILFGVGMILGPGCGDSEPTDSTPDGLLPSCTIVDDGEISKEELPFNLGVSALYVRNTPGTLVNFSPDGREGSENSRSWDFSTGPGDSGSPVTLLDPAAVAQASLFPDATHASPLLVETPSLLGVYQVKDDGVYLLGVTTAEAIAPASEWRVVYDSPVPVLKFPLREGDAWEHRATFRDARVGGIPENGVEEYRFSVDASGSVTLPNDITQEGVLRIRVELIRTLAIASGSSTSTVHQLLWMGPCSGELARVVGSDPSFSQVSELRRLIP